MIRQSGIVQGLLIVSLVLIGPLGAASRPGPLRFNQGGPDSYGYRFIDNINESGGPSYSNLWQDISSTGTALTISGDEQSTTFTCPILIRFYGQNWGTAPTGSGLSTVNSSIGVSTNAFLRLLGSGQTMTAGPFGNTALPSTNVTITPGGFIAAFWDDGQMNGANDSAQWEVVGTAPNRKLIVQWTNWGYFGAGGLTDMTIQIQIAESNGLFDSEINFIYVGSTDAREGGNSATIGIQGPGGTSALQYSFNAANSTTANSSGDPRVIKYYHPSASNHPPDVPTNAAQAGTLPESSLQALPDPQLRSGWTRDQVSFSANVSDPDAGQTVRLRARVKLTASSTWTLLDSGLQTPGLLTIAYPIPSSGDYDWEYRVEDQYGFSYPPAPVADPAGWIPAFSNGASPDFRSDQVAPDPPRALSPAATDLSSFHMGADLVTFTWTPSVDNGPGSALRYDVEVSRDSIFTDVESVALNVSATTATLSVTVTRFQKFWRVRSTDIGGNASEWSNVQPFRLIFDDQINHAAGDAQKNCGFSPAGATANSAGLFLIALAGLILCGRRRRRRSSPTLAPK